MTASWNPEGPKVVSVSRSSKHNFSKDRVESVLLVEGLGVDGDAHSGTTVQHVFRKRSHPTEPNLRQVHVIHRNFSMNWRRTAFRYIPGTSGKTSPPAASIS